MAIQEGQQTITQAVTDCQVKVRGLGHPCVNPPTQQPFIFDCSRGSPKRDASEDGGSDHQPSPCHPKRLRLQ